MAAKSKAPRWAYITRQGGEQDLLDELPASCAARVIAPALVMAERRPESPPAFARQAMRSGGPAMAARTESAADGLSRAIIAAYPDDARWRWTLQVVAVDSSQENRALARAIDADIAKALDGRLPRRIGDAYVDDPAEAERIAAVWIVEGHRAFVGFTAAADALTVSPGGQPKVARDANAASKSAAKLEEAFEWVGIEPGPGEDCVDLGAAPGGWTQVVVARGAKVTAVDRRPLSIALPKKRFTPIGADAFAYDPGQTVDWLFADLNQKPMEVAKLIGKWGRRAWARQLLCSIKLPMKQKARAVEEIRSLLEGAGWRGVKARQLPSDKNEITIYAWLDPKIAGRGYQPPFELGSKRRKR